MRRDRFETRQQLAGPHSHFIGLNLWCRATQVASPSDGRANCASTYVSQLVGMQSRASRCGTILKPFSGLQIKPGAWRHGNRNTGTSGYKASVDYVAGLMRGAAIGVRSSPYKWADFSVTGVPAFDAPVRLPDFAGLVCRTALWQRILTALAQPTGGAGARCVDSQYCCSRSRFRRFVPDNRSSSEGIMRL